MEGCACAVGTLVWVYRKLWTEGRPTKPRLAGVGAHQKSPELASARPCALLSTPFLQRHSHRPSLPPARPQRRTRSLGSQRVTVSRSQRELLHNPHTSRTTLSDPTNVTCPSRSKNTALRARRLWPLAHRVSRAAADCPAPDSAAGSGSSGLAFEVSVAGSAPPGWGVGWASGGGGGRCGGAGRRRVRRQARQAWATMWACGPDAVRTGRGVSEDECMAVKAHREMALTIDTDA